MMLRQFVFLKDGCYVRLYRLVEVVGKSVDNLYLLVPIFILSYLFQILNHAIVFSVWDGMSYFDIYFLFCTGIS
jgi:hypothetical protein